MADNFFNGTGSVFRRIYTARGNVIKTVATVINSTVDKAANWIDSRPAAFNDSVADTTQFLKGLAEASLKSLGNLIESGVNDLEESNREEIASRLNDTADAANTAYSQYSRSKIAVKSDELKDTFDELTKYRKYLMEYDIPDLVDYRTKLYENFLTALTGNYYLNQISNSLNDIKLLDDICNESAEDLSKTKVAISKSAILDNIEKALVVFKNIDNNSKDNIYDGNNGKTLKTVGNYFLTKFSSYGKRYYKKDVDFSYSSGTPVVNFDNVIHYSPKETEPKLSNLPFNIDINFYEAGTNLVDTGHEVVITTKSELILENGTEEYPYIVKNAGNLYKSGVKHVVNDFTTQSSGTVNINNLDGHNHQITFNVGISGNSNISLNITSTKNLKIKMVYDNDIGYSYDVDIHIGDDCENIIILANSLYSKKEYFSNGLANDLGLYQTKVSIDSDTIIKDDNIIVDNSNGYFEIDERETRITEGNDFSSTDAEYDYSKNAVSGRFVFKKDRKASEYTAITTSNNISVVLQYTGENESGEKSFKLTVSHDDVSSSTNFTIKDTLSEIFLDSSLEKILINFGELSLLASGIKKLKEYKGNDWFTYYEKLLEDLADRWGLTTRNIEKSIDEKKSAILSYANSFNYIISYRENNSSTFDKTYTSTFINNIMLLSDYVSSYDTYKNSLDEKLEKYVSTASDTIVNIGSALLTINKYLGEYLPLFAPDTTDDDSDIDGTTALNTLLTVFDESLNQVLESDEWDFITIPETTRSFSEWYNTVSTKYINDSVHILFLLYSSQELGLNLNELTLEDNSDIGSILKQLFNRALLSCMYRHSYSEAAIKSDSLLQSKLNDDNFLNQKSIEIRENAIYEVLPYDLKDAVPALAIFEKVDFYDILTGTLEARYFSDGNISELAAENKAKVQKIINMVDIIFLKEIFKVKNNITIRNKIKEIYDILFSSCKDIGFKVLLLRVLFIKLLNDIWNSIDKSENANILLTKNDFAEIGFAYKTVQNKQSTYVSAIFADSAVEDLEKFIGIWGVYYNGLVSLLSYTNNEFIEYMTNAENLASSREYVYDSETFFDRIGSFFEKGWRVFSDQVQGKINDFNKWTIGGQDA